MGKLSTILLAIVLITVASDAMAGTSFSAAGNDLLLTVTGLISGSLGTLVGLVISLMGCYFWLVHQQMWGIVIVFGGVAFTAFPGIFQWMTRGFDDINTYTQTGTTDANQ